jgi:hypothetical protein
VHANEVDRLKELIPVETENNALPVVGYVLKLLYSLLFKLKGSGVRLCGSYIAVDIASDRRKVETAA